MPPPPFFLISVLLVLCSGEAVQQVSVSAQQVSVSTQQVLACLRGGGVHAGTRGRSDALGSVLWFGEGASAGARTHTVQNSGNASTHTTEVQICPTEPIKVNCGRKKMCVCFLCGCYLGTTYQKRFKMIPPRIYIVMIQVLVNRSKCFTVFFFHKISYFVH